MWLGTVGAGDAGAVEHERDAAAVERDVHQDLVEGAVEERRVDGHHGVHATHREAGGAGDGVLLGDADVEDPLGVRRREPIETDRVEHGGGDPDDVLALGAERDHLLGEEVGPDPSGGAGLAGLDVEGADLVELVGLVALGGVVAEPLVGHHMDDHRAAEALGLRERLLDRLAVVAVDRADVLQAEVLEHPLRRQGVLHALLHRVEGVVDGRPDTRHLVEAALHGIEHLLVARVRAQRGEVGREPPDGRHVGAPVVVDDHHQLAVLAHGDVVERLPGHAAGQRAVADHGYDVAVLATQGEGLGQTVGVGQRRGRVGVLDHVVVGLVLAGVPGQAALGAERVELRGAAGEHLVDVGLVAGVPHHPVARGVEDPVDRQRQLDDAEVGAEMAATRGAGAHQLVADLARQRGQLVVGEVAEIAGSGDLLQQCHAFPLVRRRDRVECRRDDVTRRGRGASGSRRAGPRRRARARAARRSSEGRQAHILA